MLQLVLVETALSQSRLRTMHSTSTEAASRPHIHGIALEPHRGPGARVDAALDLGRVSLGHAPLQRAVVEHLEQDFEASGGIEGALGFPRRAFAVADL